MSAPLDHVSRRYERITVPPDGKPQLVCDYWPECMCASDCVDRRDARIARRTLIALAIAALAIAIGLVPWGMRP